MDIIFLNCFILEKILFIFSVIIWCTIINEITYEAHTLLLDGVSLSDTRHLNDTYL